MKIFTMPSLRSFVYVYGFLLVFLVVRPLPVAVAGNSDGSRDNNSKDNNSNNENYSEQSSASKVDFFTRIDSDMADMWLTAPSAWTPEYFQVFGGMVLIVLLSIGMLLFLCCAPICCCREAHRVPKQLQVKTKEELWNDQMKRNNLESSSATHASLNAATRNNINPRGIAMSGTDICIAVADSPEQGPASMGPTDVASAKQQANNMMVKRNNSCNSYASGSIICNKTTDQQEAANNHGKPSPMANKLNEADEGPFPFQRVQASKKRCRTSLWSEVVSVWTEFFQHGLNVPLEAVADEAQHNYKPLQEEDIQSRRTTSRSASVPMLRTVGTATTPKRLKIKHKSSTSSSKRPQKRLVDVEIGQADKNDNSALGMTNQGTMV